MIEIHLKKDHMLTEEVEQTTEQKIAQEGLTGPVQDRVLWRTVDTNVSIITHRSLLRSDIPSD